MRLSAPPPLGVPLRLETSTDSARLTQGDTLIGAATAATLDLDVPDPPSFDVAEEAAQGYPGFDRHTFPTCFVCGPERDDGLRIFPGPVAGTDTVAGPWVPDAALADDSGTVDSAFVWAALDCPSAFVIPEIVEGGAAVLGELVSDITETITPGDRCVVIAWFLGGEGRKRHSATAIFGPSGDLVGKARATWVTVPAHAWG